MAGETWAAPGGISQGIGDAYNLNALAMQPLQAAHTMGQIQQQPAQLRLLNAQAGTAELGLTNQQNLQKYMMQAASEGRPATFETLSDLSMAAGDYKTAISAANTGSLQAYRRIAGDAAQARQAAAELAGVKQKLELRSQMFTGVNDQASFDATVAALERQFPEDGPSPLRGAKYSPEIVNMVRESGLTTMQQLTEQYRKQRLRQIDTHEQALQGYRGLMSKIRVGTYNLAVNREDRLNRNGGKALASPSGNELTMANTLVPKEFTDPQERVQVATQLASRAKALMKMHPGKDYSQALNEALTEARKNGDIQIQPAQGFFGKGGAKYTGGGNTPEMALPIPATKEDLKGNKWYILPSGDVGRFNGNGFDVPEEGGNSDLNTNPDDPLDEAN